MGKELEVSRHRLPPELTDRIIDFLHDDIPALANCGLVCRTWLPSSRLHLFRRIEILQPVTTMLAWSQRAESRDKFEDLIRTSPRLRHYVGELVVTLASEYDTAFLLRTARHFGRVRDLTLHSYMSLPPNAHALAALGRPAALTLVAPLVRAPSTLAAYLIAFPSVETLCLAERGVETFFSEAGVATLITGLAQAPRLRDLTVCGQICMLVSEALKARPLETIVHLGFAPDHGSQWPALHAMLGALSATLTHLSVSLLKARATRFRIDAQQCRAAFRACEKHTRLEFSVVALQDSLRVVSTVLDAIAPSQLNVVVIKLYSVSQDGPPAPLGYVGQLLANEMHFPDLKVVNVVYAMESGCDTSKFAQDVIAEIALQERNKHSQRSALHAILGTLASTLTQATISLLDARNTRTEPFLIDARECRAAVRACASLVRIEFCVDVCEETLALVSTVLDATARSRLSIVAIELHGVSYYMRTAPLERVGRLLADRTRFPELSAIHIVYIMKSSYDDIDCTHGLLRRRSRDAIDWGLFR
ncbi:hypothetical protein CERSUDRAFT_100782 [Gelatoporia subvermispora B]|uniref:F-box domain-containing protein n=1 Tax=Ceriporiopsis subvermispora (strain B) TaxID=914234 RepID=M2Q2G6_CERS8|nr:hypothetical protein CERSUDRAFT_100782 [Gelatoporia subvermispora B]